MHQLQSRMLSSSSASSFAQHLFHQSIICDTLPAGKPASREMETQFFGAVDFVYDDAIVCIIFLEPLIKLLHTRRECRGELIAVTVSRGLKTYPTRLRMQRPAQIILC
mmetsp:Transcript_28154/g.59993  ORF Transcript_28154/g.59993 Transcript_28154/m.59993 type:complete len:108 (-) Transcript_28154:19-342(-)